MKRAWFPKVKGGGFLTRGGHWEFSMCHLSYSIDSGGSYGLAWNHYAHTCALSMTWWPIVRSTLPIADFSFSSRRVELKGFTIHCWGVFLLLLKHRFLVCDYVLPSMHTEDRFSHCEMCIVPSFLWRLGVVFPPVHGGESILHSTIADCESMPWLHCWGRIFVSHCC